MQIEIKPEYNDHPWDPKIVAIADKWSLFEVTQQVEIQNGTLKLWPL